MRNELLYSNDMKELARQIHSTSELVCDQRSLALQSHTGLVNPSNRFVTDQTLSRVKESHIKGTIMASMPKWHSAFLPCTCLCHQRKSKRSSRSMNGTIGTFLAEFSGLPYLTPRCNNWSCVQSCKVSDVHVSLTYFIPMWLLSWVLTLIVKRSKLGFDYTFRVYNYVSYSSPIFQCAYQGNVIGMRGILKSKSGSCFDVTRELQRSLLGV